MKKAFRFKLIFSASLSILVDSFAAVKRYSNERFEINENLQQPLALWGRKLLERLRSSVLMRRFIEDLKIGSCGNS
jgi:hypothetical protein